jgi:hypothetical protein
MMPFVKIHSFLEKERKDFSRITKVWHYIMRSKRVKN